MNGAAALVAPEMPKRKDEFATVRTRDRRIVAGCLKGDEGAWTELWVHYGPVVKAIARRVGCDAEEAKDVVQRVALIALQGLDRLRDHKKLGGWLAGTARYQALTVIRKRSPSGELHPGVAIDDLGADAAYEKEQELLALREAMAKLDERCRRLVRALDLKDPPDTYHQVAEAEGLAPTSIGPIRRRCLRRLKKFIESVSQRPGAAH